MTKKNKSNDFIRTMRLYKLGSHNYFYWHTYFQFYVAFCYQQNQPNLILLHTKPLNPITK